MFYKVSPRAGRTALFAGVALAISLGATGASAQALLGKYNFTKGDKAPPLPTEASGGPVVLTSPTFSPAVVKSFEGISQYDVASVRRNFIPPDTIAAAGKTQIMEFVNGGVAVFNKATGVRSSFTSDTVFWNSVGQTGIPNGDSRVMYNADADRWIALSFAPNTKDIQIAVSSTSDALGAWKSTRFEGFAPLAPGARMSPWSARACFAQYCRPSCHAR